MKAIKVFLQIGIIILLTITTQIGGVIYLGSFLLFRKKKFLKYIVFVAFYLLSTFIIVPAIAPLFGREKITETNTVKPHFFFYKLANRNYVTPDLNRTLTTITNKFEKQYPTIELRYLDANFPFFNGFPLLPHLSHNDGKKLDITLIYEENKVVTNKKASVSGYGAFENPKASETNQTTICKNYGNWQYDFSKYLSLGSINNGVSFSEKASKYLIKIIASQPSVTKIFIEPHLKQRMNIKNSKIRFHGCQAVRHDDHIHFQVK